MSFIKGINDWSSAILKIFLIIVIIAAAGYMGLSIYANMTEDRIVGIPDMPDISDAQYEFRLSNTGDIILTNDYDTVETGSYILHGFYDIIKGKWKWYKGDLPLNEYYFGEIIIERR